MNSGKRCCITREWLENGVSKERYRMTAREEIRQLAQIESAESCAISFYYQPQPPQDKSHREEIILVKDLVRECLRKHERNGNRTALREDLQRILGIAEQLHGNHSRGKVIFACKDRAIWKEMDVPPRLGRSRLVVNSRFHLQPLMAAYSGLPHACVALVDRLKARIFALHDQEWKEKPDLYFGDMPPAGRSDGYHGYDAGHRERHVENEMMQRFKQFADSLHTLMNRDHFDVLLIGCRDETWPEIMPHLHSDVKRRLIERFPVDPGLASAQEVHQQAEAGIRDFIAAEEQGMIREMMAEAQRNGRSALGLRHVLSALERQEVQTLLVGRDFQAEAVECGNCGHMDTRMVRNCAVCSSETKELTDVADALVALALRNGADIRFIDDDSDLEKAGKVGALLRFRADRNTARQMAV
jgi:peptide subunit release factor 1 (eRF1)